VTTQPSLSAALIAALRLAGAERVLGVGTGHGYQITLLARLAVPAASRDHRPYRYASAFSAVSLEASTGGGSA
jgi:protein-L-isoaspartate(D-aspartate) O-methyltransferase